MKKILSSLLVCSILSGCINAGDHDLLPFRKKIINAFNSYAITFKDEKDEFIGSRKMREHDTTLNKAVTVKKGESILSDKTYNRDSYRKYVYRPTKKGTIDNHSYPVQLDNKKEYDIVGWVSIDGKEYSVMESNLDDFVILFDADGNFYEHAGRIEDGRLVVFDEHIFVYPSDMKMLTLAKMRDDISNIKNGYDVKYAGTKLDRIWFDYMDYDEDYNQAGLFEKLNFPNKPGLIMINGIGLRILRADDDSITYMVLSDPSGAKNQ